MQHEARKREADVAVVGGGLSGIAAARALARGGLEVVVLEARDRLGGRAETVTVDGVVVDLGATWIGPPQPRVVALADELGIATQPWRPSGDVTLLGRRRSRARRLALAVEQAAAQRVFDRLARRVDTEHPWRSPGASALDNRTLESWLRRRTLTRAGRGVVGRVLTGVFATDPGDVSLLHALFYVRAAGGLGPLLAAAGGAQDRRFPGGAQRLVEAAAAELGDVVELGSPVRAVSRREDSVTVTADGVEVEARRAIVAVPPLVADEIDLGDAGRADVARALPHGAVLKAAAIFDSPFWRADGLSGGAYGPSVPISFSADLSPEDGSVGVLGIYCIGPRARAAAALSPSDRRELLLGTVAEAFGPRVRRPDAYVERDWTAEQWTRGCWGGFMPPRAWTRVGARLREPSGRLHWASAETATSWPGYLEGALQAGERAAAEVLDAL